MVILLRLLIALIISALAGGSYAGVTAKLEREQIRINETVRLLIETDAAGESQPDLSMLEQHFKIIGRSSGQNISIVDGKQSVVRRWTIELEPKSVGSFSLDPINLGSEQSNRLRIAILPAAKTASTGAEVFIEVETDADSVYVQQQLLLSVKLFLRARLLDGSLSDPEPDDAIVRRVGQDIRYETRRANKTYSVFERRYAIFPQKSGDLKIPPFQFQGLAQDSGQSNQQMFNSLFNQGRRIRASSDGLSIKVKPQEVSFSGNRWLPAKKIQIEHVGEPVEKFEVGQPITLKIQLQALGLTAEQLPEIVIPETPGLRLYPDQSIFETQDNDKDVIGIQLKNVAVIPNQSGALTLPDIEIKWWNTETNRAETARLSGRQILVQDAVAASAPKQSKVDDVTSTLTPEVSVSDQTIYDPQSSSIWKWLAIGSLGLWVLSIVLWISTGIRRPAKTESTPNLVNVNENEWRNRIRAACRENNPISARAAILGWGRCLFGPTMTLEQISAEVSDPELASEILALDRVLYASESGTTEWGGQSLWELVERFKSKSASKPIPHNSLQPLYP